MPPPLCIKEPDMIQITAPHFCAGLRVMDGRVIEAAPIVRYMLGWTIQEVSVYVHKKRWDLAILPDAPPPDPEASRADNKAPSPSTVGYCSSESESPPQSSEQSPSAGGPKTS